MPWTLNELLCFGGVLASGRRSLLGRDWQGSMLVMLAGDESLR